jgi:DNA repair protein RecO (recombination protein O)
VRLAEVVGVAPALEACASCGRRDGLHRFSFAAGGVVCGRCSAPGAYALRAGLIPYLAALATADLGDLPVHDPALTGDALGVARRFVEYHLDRRLESLAAVADV